MEFWCLCFLHNRHANDAGLGATLLRQWFTFHGCYARVWLWSVDERRGVPSEVREMVVAVQELGKMAHRALERTEHLARKESLS
jgi:hypothetical protein